MLMQTCASNGQKSWPEISMKSTQQIPHTFTGQLFVKAVKLQKTILIN